MYTQVNAPVAPSYSSTAAATGSVIFLALLACAIAAAVVVHRRRSRQAANELDRETVEAWFEAPSLAGFPTQRLHEMLPAIDQAKCPRLQTAWLLASTRGHDAAWLTGHFGLSPDVARLLADSAQRPSTQTVRR